MSTARESEVANLRRVAEDLAKQRGERATTGHLLAAIATKRSAAADLLKERRLDAEVLLKAARVVTDDARDALARTVERAIQFAAAAQSRSRGRCTSSSRSARSGRRPRTGRSSSAGPT